MKTLPNRQKRWWFVVLVLVLCVCVVTNSNQYQSSSLMCFILLIKNNLWIHCHAFFCSLEKRLTHICHNTAVHGPGGSKYTHYAQRTTLRCFDEWDAFGEWDVFDGFRYGNRSVWKMLKSWLLLILHSEFSVIHPEDYILSILENTFLKRH